MKQPLLTGVALLTLILSACDSTSGSDDNSPVNDQRDQVQGNVYQVNASDYDSWVYWDLETQSVVSVSEPQSDSDWDIALRRSSILLNGGDAGAGETQGTVGDDQPDFYDGSGEPNPSVFLNASAGMEVNAFDSVVDDAGLTYMSETNTPAIEGSDGWYSYNMTTHTVTANDDQYWIVRSASGDSYARLRVTALTTSGRELASVTLGLGVQGVADSSFGSETETTIAVTDGASCFDIDTMSSVADCTGDSWDLRVASNFEIWLNSGVHGSGQGGALGPLVSAELSAFSAGSNVPHWTADEAKGVFSENSWYAYNLQGSHKLWPNYRVYIIDNGSAKYKLQVLSYYSETGESAQYSLRIDSL